MIAYTLKFILCSAILFTFYHLGLRQEKAFKFNRFFLLSIIILAAVIPVTIIRISIIEVPIMETQLTDGIAAIGPPVDSKSIIKSIPGLTIQEALTWVYTIISSLLLLRFILNLWSLNRFKKGGQLVLKDGLKLVLRQDINHSFSFLTHMYTNKEGFEQGRLPKEILAHEKAHIQQKHSYDILFIELIACLFWFNPFVYFIKRAIKLNHEFLADEVAISQTGSLTRYQNIIINFASQRMMLNPSLASHLTFGETKKRITIMVKIQNKTITVAKQIMTMVVTITLFASLGETKVIAQESDKNIITTAIPFLVKEKVLPQKEPIQTQDKKKVQDKKTTIEPPMLIGAIPRVNSKVRYSNSNGQRVTATFGELSDQVRKDFLELKLDGEIWLAPKPKDHLTQAILDDFKNAKKYGVWIDGSKVDNAVLNRHKPEDFHHFFKSKLGKEAKNFGQYTYHLVLVTQKTFEKVPSRITGKWIKYNEQIARAQKYLDSVEDKN